MTDPIKLSRQTLAVLQALLDAAAAWRYGYDLSRETGLKSGTLYPILARLAERDWLASCWEHAEENGKPRHMYRLTPEGLRSARAALQKKTAGLGALRPAYRGR